MPAGEHAKIVGRYGWYVLGLLTLINMLNFVDRQVIFILVEPIKHDLSMSDTQVGLLTGIAFAVVYGLTGLWLARIADRYSRPAVIAASVVFWSVMTALGALAARFWQLAASRLGVAVGEAGCTPAAHGLIAEFFPPDRRAMAISLFQTSTPVGVMLGFTVGGQLAALVDWRATLVWVGLPGMVLGGLFASTVRAPARRPQHPQREGSGAARTMLRMASFRHMMAAAMLISVAGYGAGVFQGSFLIRLHGYSIAKVGFWLGLVVGIGGGLGTFLGGIGSDWLGRKDVRWRQFLPALGTLLAAPATLGAWFVADGPTAVLLLAAANFFGLLYLGPTFGVAQLLAPPWARATASALILLALSLVGQSTGPLVVGMLSDALRPAYGVQSLRLALCVVVPFQLWSAVHFYLAGRRLPNDLAQMNARMERQRFVSGSLEDAL